MPQVHVTTPADEGIVYFLDGVPVSEQTYTYDNPQASFTLTNTGTRNLIWNVGDYTDIIVPPGAVETRIMSTAGVSSFRLRAQYGYQSFTMRSEEISIALPTLAGLSSQLADMSSKRLEEFTYNLNALRKIRSKQFWSAVSIGDSIAAGTAASNNLGFLQQLNNAMRVLENRINYENDAFYYASNVSTWTKEEIGICKFLLSSKTGSTNLSLFQFAWFYPPASYTVQVVYSKRPDGGTFQVGYGSTPTILDTINCNGTIQDGIISATYTVPANQNFYIIPTDGQKAYINNVVVVRNSSKPYYAFDNWSVGGRKAKDYTVQDLQTMLAYLPKDLLIWELFANDYAGGDYDSYVNRTEAVLTQAKALGMDILIPIACGNSGTPTDTNWRNKWVAYLYDVAKRYDAAIIDYDIMFGGFTKANANGLLADAIHPTDKGHLLMANALIDVLLGIKNPYFSNVVPTADNSTYMTYGYKKDANNVYYPNSVAFDNQYLRSLDSNGNPQYTMTQPVINTWLLALLPKYAPQGWIASVGSQLYLNTTDWGTNKNIQATWTKLYAVVQEELVTVLPTAAAGNQGRMVLLDGGGTIDDKMYVCMRTATNAYVWKQVTLT